MSDKQAKVFASWANTHLKKRDLKIDDLSTDLSTGHLLNNLLELLSQKSLPKWTENPKMKVQKIENIGKGLDFLQEEERVRIVNIGGSDIEDGNMTCILGLVWTMIQHYQISGGGKKKVSKKDIITFSRRANHGKEISKFEDFRESWAITGLVNHLEPGALDDSNLGADNEAEINIAMDYAENKWGDDCPKIMEASDMANEPDELGMMTYVSYYYQLSLAKYGPLTDDGTPAQSSEVVEAAAEEAPQRGRMPSIVEESTTVAAVGNEPEEAAQSSEYVVVDKPVVDATARHATIKSSVPGAQSSSMGLSGGARTQSQPLMRSRKIVSTEEEVDEPPPKGEELSESYVSGPGVQGVAEGGMEDYAMLFSCSSTSTVTSTFQSRAEENALVGMCGQKVYSDQGSNTCFTFMDWNKREYCDRWQGGDGKAQLAQAGTNDVAFEGFVENRTGSIGVARHSNYNKGVMGRYLVCYKVADVSIFIRTLRGQVIKMRNDGLLSEELYISEKGGDNYAIMIYEFGDPAARDEFGNDKLENMRKALDVQEVIKETNMDTKEKIRFPNVSGQFLVFAKSGGQLRSDANVWVQVQNESTGKIEKNNVTSRGDGTFLVSYTQLRCSYSITILVNGWAVQGSPQRFRVSGADPSKSRAEGAGLTGKGSSFTLFARDSMGRPVRDAIASVRMASSAGPITVNVMPMGDGSFKCDWNERLKEGEYFIDAEVDNMDVSNCPVTFTKGKGAKWQSRHSLLVAVPKKAAFSAAHSFTDGPGTDGSGLNFTIHARTKLSRPSRGVFATAELVGPEGPIDLELAEDDGKGNFAGSYPELLAAGWYTLTAKLNDEVIKGSPHRFLVAKRLRQEDRLSEDQDIVQKVYHVGRQDGMNEFQWEITNNTNDAWEINYDFEGTTGMTGLSDDFKQTVVVPEGETKTVLVLIQASLEVTVTYTESITFTWTASTVAQLDAQACYAEGPGLNAFDGAGMNPDEEDKMIPFTVYAVDTKGAVLTDNEGVVCTAELNGLGGQREVTVEPQEDGSFKCFYDNMDLLTDECKISAGYYSLEVHLNGKAIRGSPFTFNVDRIRQSKANVENRSLIEERFQIGNEDDTISFDFVLTNKEKTPWLIVYDFSLSQNLGPIPDDGGCLEYTLEPEEVKNVHYLTQQDPEEGFYLKALAHAHEIPQLCASQSFAEGYGLVGNAGSGQPMDGEEYLTFAVWCMDTQNRIMSRYIKREEEEEEGPGSCKGHLAPAINAQAKLQGPDGDIDVTMEQQEDGSFLARYGVLGVAGVHHLAIDLEGQPIKDSPFKFMVDRVRIGQAEKISTEGELWEHVYQIGREDGLRSFQWELENKTDDPWVIDHDFNSVTNLAPIKKLGDWPENRIYTTEVPARSTVVVTTLVQQDGSAMYSYDGVHRPFVAEKSLFDPKASTVEGHGLTGNDGLGSMEDGTALVCVARCMDTKGRPVNPRFVHTEAELVGPDGPVEVEVKDNGDGSYNIEYQALQVAGPYTLEVICNNEDLVGSPSTFVVERLPQSSAKLSEGVELYNNVYQIGRADGLRSFQWEVENKTEDAWLVNYNFTGTENMGDLPEDEGEEEMLVEPGETAVVSCLVQIDGASPYDVKLVTSAEEKSVVNPSASYVTGTAITANEGKGHGEAVEGEEDVPEEERPLRATVYAVDTKDRMCNPKFVESQAFLDGPDGRMEVSKQDNGDGSYSIEYAALKTAGPYQLHVLLNDQELEASPYKFVVDKLPQESTKLDEDAEIYERVYQIGREDGLRSFQWELENNTEDTWVVEHDFTGSENLGELPEDGKYITEVPAGETVVVCCLAQIDRDQPYSYSTSRVVDEKPVLDVAASSVEGPGLTANSGLGHGDYREPAEGEEEVLAADTPLRYVSYAVDTKGRPALAKYMQSEATLVGPDGEIEVECENRGDGSFEYTYPALKTAGPYQLRTVINDEVVAEDSILVEKIPETQKELTEGLTQHVYQIGREDGLRAFQWEIENTTEDTWCVMHDFSGTENMGDLPEDCRILTECPPGETTTVVCLHQLDGEQPYSYACNEEEVLEKGHYYGLQEQRAEMPAAIEELKGAPIELPDTGIEFVLFTKAWDEDEMKLASASPWARKKMAAEADQQDSFFKRALNWLSPPWSKTSRNGKRSMPAPADAGTSDSDSALLARIARLEQENRDLHARLEQQNQSEETYQEE